jgi:hypothetical protein
MMCHRLATTFKRAGRGAGIAAGVAAAALLVVCNPVTARPRPLSAWEVAQTDGPLAPAQRDELLPSQRGGVSLEQATAMARSRFQGRVVRAETVRVGDRLVHESRILGEDGRTVRTVRIDAQTGAFL